MIRDILFNSKIIAIVGLSPNPTKDSNMVARYLQNNGYKLVPIYPSEDEILGCKVYRNISDALRENDIDIIVVFRKSEVALNIAKEVIDNINYSTNLKAFWLQINIINDSIKDLLAPYNIHFVQNKCIKIEHQLLLD